jgi:hypothetical protein
MMKTMMMVKMMIERIGYNLYVYSSIIFFEENFLLICLII